MTTIAASAPYPQAGAPRVVLPSIHELFPEHLLHRHHAPSYNPTKLRRVGTPPPPRAFSFDVLKSDPGTPSLTHLLSSHPVPQRRTSRSHNSSRAGSVSGSSEGDTDADAEADGDAIDDVDGGRVSARGKRHPCPTCGRRFNRPSSLKIHANSHTGAQPFICPHRGCGRAFNVNSNMRRHFRNHSDPSAPPAQPRSENSVFTSTFPAAYAPLDFTTSYVLGPAHLYAAPRDHPHIETLRVVPTQERTQSPASPAESPPSASWSISSGPSPISPASPSPHNHNSHSPPAEQGTLSEVLELDAPTLRHPPSVWHDAVAYLRTDPGAPRLLRGYSESDVRGGA